MQKFRAALRPRAAAFLLGTAAIAGLAALTALPAQAAVHAAVGKPLNEAKDLAAAHNFSAALAKVKEADAAATTAEEHKIVDQMRQYIEFQAGKAGQVDSKLAAQTKFADDFHSGKWSEVIQDSDLLRKFGALDGQSMAAIAGAYYRAGNMSGCVRYIRDNFGNGASEDILRLEMTCAYNSGNDDVQTAVLQELVSRTGKPEYWKQLLRSAERTKGLSDHDTLDIYRIKLLTGSMNGPDDYTTLAQLALQLGFPSEALAVEQKALAAKVSLGNRADALIGMTKGEVAKNMAASGKDMADAKASSNGDALVKMGEDLWGQAKYKDAIEAIQAGIAKDKTNLNNAHIRLGMAYLGAGQKDAAIHAFNQVKDDPKEETIAHLWALYARK